MECPFCTPAVYEKQLLFETPTERVLCNIRPATLGQCLVVPKMHVSTLRELSDDQMRSFFATVREVASVLQGSLQPVGFNYGCNEGPYAGQSVEHFHFHILPRYKDDRVPEFHLFHRHPDTKRDLNDEELTSLTVHLRTFFG